MILIYLLCNINVILKLPVFFQAEQLVKVKFPEHIVELNKLVDEPKYCWNDLTKVHQDLGIPQPKSIAVLNK